LSSVTKRFIWIGEDSGLVAINGKFDKKDWAAELVEPLLGFTPRSLNKESIKSTTLKTKESEFDSTLSGKNERVESTDVTVVFNEGRSLKVKANDDDKKLLPSAS